MEKSISARFASYAPVAYKSFPGALNAFFENELPALGGSRIRMTIVNAICAMVAKFFPETIHLQPGQTPWVTVSVDSRGAYGKRIKDTALVPVVLDLVQDVDARERALGKKVRDVKKEAVARLCNQAYEQGGCMTATEIAVLLKMSAVTVGKYMAEYESEHEIVLPRRGTIHDMGPTLTHKKAIIEKLFVKQETVQQVIRETCHSARAIERYITSFKQVLMCYRKQMTLEEIAFAVHKTPRLVQEYLNIIEVYKEQGYIMDRLMEYEVQMETAEEFYEPYYNTHRR
jgi:hypothetical protein